MAEESYYELLQVQPTADVEVIRAAYRSLARRYHPDQNPSPSAEATTKRLNAAWEVLSDPAKRAEYDRTFAGGSSSRPAPPPRPQNPPTQETPPPRPPKQTNTRDAPTQPGSTTSVTETEIRGELVATLAWISAVVLVFVIVIGIVFLSI